MSTWDFDNLKESAILPSEMVENVPPTSLMWGDPHIRASTSRRHGLLACGCVRVGVCWKLLVRSVRQITEQGTNIWWGRTTYQAFSRVRSHYIQNTHKTSMFTSQLNSWPPRMGSWLKFRASVTFIPTYLSAAKKRVGKLRPQSPTWGRESITARPLVGKMINMQDAA